MKKFGKNRTINIESREPNTYGKAPLCYGSMVMGKTCTAWTVAKICMVLPYFIAQLPFTSTFNMEENCVEDLRIEK
jgi:hypothetical protein